MYMSHHNQHICLHDVQRGYNFFLTPHTQKVNKCECVKLLASQNLFFTTVENVHEKKKERFCKISKGVDVKTGKVKSLYMKLS